MARGVCFDVALAPGDEQGTTVARRLSLIMPCFNERATLRAIVRRVLDAPPAEMEKELIIVDDASTDGSREILNDLAQAHPQIKALYHDRNRGKGAAIRTAQRACTGDVVIIQDADLEYDPRCYPDLITPILAGQADVVYGSRFAGGRPRRALLFWHEVGNRLLTLISNMATDLNLTDMETCYKAFRRNYFQGIPLRSRRFGFEPEITAKVAKLGLRVYEVPIEYHGRTYFAGKKIGWKDGVTALCTIVRYWLTDGLAGMDEGLETLQAMRHARRYNAWIFLRIAPFIGERVLEAGTGIGNITQHMLSRQLVIALDHNPHYVERMRHAFGHNPNVRVELFDLTDISAYERFKSDRLDTIICINVLEHVEPDVGVLRTFQSILAPGGRAIILVPQGPSLYGSIDKALGHHRRYTQEELAGKMSEAGFAVEHISGLNRTAPLGWLVNGRILKRKAVPVNQVRLLDAFVPLIRILDRVLPLPALSLIAIGRKSGL
jgi:glycosyltransferase involved in cell wall biosynthesis